MLVSATFVGAGGTSLVPCHARCRVGCSVCVGGVGDRQEDDRQCFVTINTLTMAIVLYLLVGDLIGVGVVNNGRVVSNTFVGMLLEAHRGAGQAVLPGVPPPPCAQSLR
ncbi:Os03g0214750 [Oryza sativa Japonica Group]|uniref:Os03g0214750 protein n=1 Tax=Oryza sativa subsp. japonica TaxID=39947 RepID=A0A0P0VUQ9_ORYSJ|nr:Os03g0214750 [Oryza sativa Japonica Group]